MSPASSLHGRRGLPRVLHLTNAEKFIPDFLRMVRREFPHQVHSFRYFGTVMSGLSWPEDRDAEFVSIRTPWSLLKLLVELHRYDKILLHGLFIKRLNIALMLMPWLLRKCYWAIWGGDLYAHESSRRNWRWVRNEFVRHQVIRRLGNLVSYIPGDIRLARTWYGATGRSRHCLLYPSNIHHPGQVLQEDSGERPTILVGNSATPTNHHSAAFELLSRLSDQNFRVVCPLSYGSPDYARTVAAEGQRLFQDRFTPLLKFVPREEYLRLLSTVSIAVFAHNRQQAMGNTITMLGLGKTVYARSELTSTAYLRSLGITVLPLNALSLRPLTSALSVRNRDLVEHHFSYETLVRQYRDLFCSFGHSNRAEVHSHAIPF